MQNDTLSIYYKIVTNSLAYRILSPNVDNVARWGRFTDDPLVIFRPIKYRSNTSDIQTTNVANPLSCDLVPHVLLKQDKTSFRQVRTKNSAPKKFQFF